MNYPNQPYVPPVPPAPKKSNVWKWLLGIGAAVVVLCLGGLGACAALGIGAVNKIDKDAAAKKSDVTITSCTTKPNKILNSVDVGYKITNSGNTKRTYLVTFAVDDATGNRLGETVGSSLDLNPGQSTADTSPVLLDKPASGKVKCLVLDVT